MYNDTLLLIKENRNNLKTIVYDSSSGVFDAQQDKDKQEDTLDQPFTTSDSPCTTEYNGLDLKSDEYVAEDNNVLINFEPNTILIEELINDGDAIQN